MILLRDWKIVVFPSLVSIDLCIKKLEKVASFKFMGSFEWFNDTNIIYTSNDIFKVVKHFTD